MEDNILKFLGLMKRAGTLGIGEQSISGDIKSGKTLLLMEASDISDNSHKRIQNISNSANVALICLPFTKYQLAEALGTGLCSMFSCRDAGFAKALQEKLQCRK